MEQKVSFYSDDYYIEALFDWAGSKRGVVITHPHPLYGGDMFNHVVESLVHTYRKNGYSTLRFNFRGMGESSGSFDDGVGEQQDVLSAIYFLLDEGIEKIDLTGYSFGAWVNAHIDCSELPVENLTVISPPVAFMDYSNISRLPNLKLVVTGAKDVIAPKDLIKIMLSRWNPDARFEIISGADHSYNGATDELVKIISEVFAPDDPKPRKRKTIRKRMHPQKVATPEK